MTLLAHSKGLHLERGDAELYVEVVGNPTGKPLVLLHGGLGSLTDSNGIIERLPPAFRLIGMDLRGHGRSTLGSQPLTYQGYQANVEAVLAHLGIASFSILGFSDGGIVAYRIAAQHPSRVDAFVTVGAQWKLDPGGSAFEMLSGLTSAAWIEMYLVLALRSEDWGQRHFCLRDPNGGSSGHRSGHCADCRLSEWLCLIGIDRSLTSNEDRPRPCVAC
jgi:pimeloyl-ACP methyl ester carboxylesterase